MFKGLNYLNCFYVSSSEDRFAGKFWLLKDEVSSRRYIVMSNLVIYIGPIVKFGCKIKEILLVPLWI